MLRWIHLAAFSLLTVASLADSVTFLRIESSMVQQRIANVPATPEQRVSTLRTMFEKAGCSKKDLLVQPVPDQPLPNIICTIPGTEYGTILIASRIDYDERGDENAVGWGGIAMLPLLAESLNSAVHRHTLVFAAFSGPNHQGAEWFWKNLTDGQRREFRGMVDLDHLGRTSPGFATASNNDTLARILPAAARALQYKPEPRSIEEVPRGNATFFQGSHVPSITIYSNGFVTSGGDEAATPKVQTVIPGNGHTQPPDSSRNFALKTALDPAVYSQTYNLLCVYVLFLDRGLSASKHPAPPVQVAKAEPPLAPAEAAPDTPVTSAPGTVAEAKSTPPAAPPVETAANVPPAAPSATDMPAMSTIRVSTRLVQFDVVVTDKDGRPVTDLKESDFTVLQDGKGQSIAAFESHTPNLAAAAAGSGAAPPANVGSSQPASTFTNIPSQAPQSSWTIVLFDLLNTPPTDQAYARNQLLQLLKSLPVGQPVALFVLTRHLEMLQGFTKDPKELLARAELLRPMQSQDLTTMAQRERDIGRIVSTAQQAAPTVSAPSQAGNVDSSSMGYGQAARIAQNYNDHEAFQNSDRALFTLAAMKGMARAVSGYPGRKNLIWLSGSFPINIEPDPASDDPFRNVRDFDTEIQTTSSLLATSRVAVYPVDVRGLQSTGVDITMATSETQIMNNPVPSTAPRAVAASSSSLGNTLTAQSVGMMNDRTTMKNIAQQTGGEAFINTNDLKRVINRSLEDGSTYYTLAYTPPKEDAGDGYHRVVVHVTNKNWKLAYRRGYYSIPNVTASGAAGTAALRTALQPGMPPSTSMALTASVELPDAKRSEVKVNYVIASNGVNFADVDGGKKRAQVDCMIIAFDSSGKEVAHASDTLDATVPLNAYAAIEKYGLPAHQLISLPPGRYNLRIGVMDRTTQQIGTVDAPLEVPANAVAQR